MLFRKFVWISLNPDAFNESDSGGINLELSFSGLLFDF